MHVFLLSYQGFIAVYGLGILFCAVMAFRWWLFAVVFDAPAKTALFRQAGVPAEASGLGVNGGVSAVNQGTGMARVVRMLLKSFLKLRRGKGFREEVEEKEK